VRLRDLLQKCYAHSYQEGARHVHLNGVEKEVPLGKMGCYGTSIPLSSANNAANDIIIAYKHNGKASSAESYLLCEKGNTTTYTTAWLTWNRPALHQVDQDMFANRRCVHSFVACCISLLQSWYPRHKQ